MGEKKNQPFTEPLFRASWQQARSGELFTLSKDFLRHSWKTFPLSEGSHKEGHSGVWDHQAVPGVQTGAGAADFNPDVPRR